MYFYFENGEKRSIKGACDIITSGEFSDGMLLMHQGTTANEQIPGLSESCDGASSYIFQIVNGQLRMTDSYTVG